MNSKNLHEATRLYETIGKYIPTDISEDVLDYVNEILENIKNDNNHDAYFLAIEIMTGKGYDELSNSDPLVVLELFIKALVEWKIIELVSFFKNIGYKL